MMQRTMGGLYRPRRGRMVAGVAIGLARRFGLPVWLVRLVWLLLLLPGGLPGILPYAILWIVMPSE
jgi:phage shock protein C